MTNPIFYYLEDWSDETMPCEPTLEGWAKWLSQPDDAWGRAKAADDGEEFEGHGLEVLGDIRVTFSDGAWRAADPVPEGADAFYLRQYQGSPGWDAEFSGATIAEALQDAEGEYGDEVWLATIRDVPRMRFRYSLADGAPALTVIGTVQ